MLKNIIILMILVLFILNPTHSYASDTVSLNELVENGKSFDGKTVTVSGEAIGEVLERSKFAWVNINDKTCAMGIWTTIENAKKIKYFGSYKQKGDIIKVTGVFNRACKEHGGDMEIHAVSFDISEQGCAITEKINKTKVVLCLTLVFVMLVLLSLFLKTRRKRAK